MGKPKQNGSKGSLLRKAEENPRYFYFGKRLSAPHFSKLSIHSERTDCLISYRNRVASYHAGIASKSAGKIAKVRLDFALEIVFDVSLV